MAEFIGARISLISKRDIRYVGTLHQISSEDATVALEQVVSYGTEGRRPDDEVPPSLDNVYEYIVFRGSDVKDLRIEEPPNKPENKQGPKVPDDPAILGSRKPQPGPSTPSTTQAPSQGGQSQPQQQQQESSSSGQNPPANQQQQQQQQQHLPPHMQGPNYGFYPPPNQRFGPQGFPPGPGYPGMPYGAPPGWYPPYNTNFPHMPPGQFPHQQMPIGPPGHNRGQGLQPHGPPGASGQPSVADKNGLVQTEKPSAGIKGPSQPNTPIPLQEAPSQPPPPPTESKPDVAAALAPPDPNASMDAKKPSSQAAKGGRIVPVVPRAGATTKVSAATNNELKAAIDPSTNISASNLTKSVEDANRDARAAVAAAMAKLPAAQKLFQQQDAAIDNLTKKVNEMRTSETARGTRGGPVGRGRGGRGGARRVEVPKADYDFESANAKFNKQDLVKEANASGSPLATPDADDSMNGDGGDSGLTCERKGSETVIIPAVKSYNKNASFFDDISSEIKDRAEGTEGKPGGRVFRNEERQKNMETFGEGSVDNSFRYGRGRGRGRGRGFRGRSRGGRGRGGAMEA